MLCRFVLVCWNKTVFNAHEKNRNVALHFYRKNVSLPIKIDFHLQRKSNDIYKLVEFIGFLGYLLNKRTTLWLTLNDINFN